MKSRFSKILLSLGVTGGTIGLGLGIGTAISGAATTTTTTPGGSTSTTAPTTAHPCPHSGSGQSSTAAY